MSTGEGLRNRITIALLAIAGGFVGSLAHEWTRKAPATIRAARFEVVDASGRIRSFWGPDVDPEIPVSTPKGTLLVFMNANGDRGSAFGSRTGDLGPTLTFYGRDRKERLGVVLRGGDDPLLAFSDSKTWHVLLGAMHGDAQGDIPSDSWALRLRTRAVSSGLLAESYDDRHRAGVYVRDEHGRSWTLPVQ